MAKRISDKPTAAQLATENARLSEENDRMKAELAESNTRLNAFEQKLDSMLASQKGDASAPAEPSVVVADDGDDDGFDVAYDDFDVQNPHKIIANPPGYMLGWKNPKYREEKRGWRGWVVVQFDDFIGRNLSKYLLDPPRRMEHATDNSVRRGDALLCYLPKNLWDARQQQRERKAHRLTAPVRDDLKTDVPRGRGTFDPLPSSGPGRIGGSTLSS